MKKLFLLTFTVLLFAACRQVGERVIENPEFMVRNSGTIEIEKVIVTDTATILYTGAYYRPNNWVMIATDTYIQADGQKYIITGADGIQLGAEHYMPASGEDKFVLYFPPLPKGTKSFDFIESDCDDCFKIWGLDLTGKYTPKSNLPNDLQNVATDNAPLKEPELKVAETTLKVYIYGMPEGYGMGGVGVYINNFLTGNQSEVTPVEKSGDVYTYRFTQYGPATAVLVVGNNGHSFLLAPGENAEVHFDVVARSTGTSRHTTFTRPLFAGFRGVYAHSNTARNIPGNQFDNGAYDFAWDPTVWRLDDAGYLQKVKDKYAEKAGEIAAMDIPEDLRMLYTMDIKTSAINSLASKKMIYDYSENEATGIFPEDGPVRPITREDMDYIKTLDPNDPYLMLSLHYYSVGGMTIRGDGLTEEQVNYMTGSQTGLLQDIRKSSPAILKAESDEEATAESLAALDTATDPFFKEMYQTIRNNAEVAKAKALADGGFVIMDTPNVPAEKILESIIAEYKGKPVFVDFWATWCGPCLNAMKTIKPFKPEMEENGVVTIYISNSSSPESKWLSMLPDIGGIHYYLESKQWRTLCDKYDVQGIPHYMIFDKSGNKTYQKAGFPGVNNLRKEFEKVW